jgi:hypothetical protein
MSSVNPYQAPQEVQQPARASYAPTGASIPPYQSAVGIGTAAKVMLGIVSIGKLASLGATIAFFIPVRDGENPFQSDGITLTAALLGVTVLGTLCLEIITAVIYLVWIFRVYKNLPALGAGPLAATPGWAVGHYFVPILNLFRPYQTMKEIWQLSAPSDAQRGATALVGWWWTGWIVCLFVGRLSDQLARSDSVDLGFLSTVAIVDVVLHSMGFATAIMAAILVHRVNRNQDERFAQQLSQPPQGPASGAFPPITSPFGDVPPSSFPVA